MKLEARVGIEPTNTAFAEPCLTTWLPRQPDAARFFIKPPFIFPTRIFQKFLILAPGEIFANPTFAPFRSAKTKGIIRENSTMSTMLVKKITNSLADLFLSE